MPPKKREKGKSAEWLQCALCKKLVSPQDGEIHSQSCEANHGYIQEKIFHGKVVKADGLLNDDGSAVTKSIRDKGSVIWLAIPTMQICGLSIGQPCIVNKTIIKRAWPSKSLQLSSIAVASQCMNELGIKEGDIITAERFIPQQNIALTATLRLYEPNKLFETAEFCAFVASYLDGKYITERMPLTVRYFGQMCHSQVTDVTKSMQASTDDESNLQTITSPVTNSSLASNPYNEASPGTPSRQINSSLNSTQNISTPKCVHQGDGDGKDPDLSDSLASLSISSPAVGNQTSTPKTPAQQQHFSNLVTPVKCQRDERKSESLIGAQFSKVISSVTRFTIRSGENEESVVNDARKPRFTLADVGGMASHIEELKSRIGRAQQPGCSSCCILLHGPAGTGKTLLIKALTAELGLNTIFLAGTDIWSKLFGEAESNLRKTFKSAQDRAPSIIVIDDIDVVCPKRSQGQAGQQEHRIVGTLLSLIDEASNLKHPSQSVVIIGITNNKDNLDPALRRAGRFGCEVEVGVPTAVQRREILEVMLNKTSNDLTADDKFTVAKNAHGYVGADLAALLNEASMHTLSRQESLSSSSSSKTSSIKLTLEDLVYAGVHVKPSALREIQLEVPEVRWTDIGGMSEVKMRLREAVELPLSNPEIFKRLGIEPPRGLLMYGPPGCSKTMVARALATECKLNFLAVKGPELFNQYVGESEKAIRQVFRKARSAAPSIVFFDEIDAIAAKRGSSSGGSGVDDRVLTQLLTEMDGLEFLKDVFIVAATNRPDKIDRALLRPGRFDSLVYVPLPDVETRKEILEKKLSKMCVASDVSLDSLAEATQDYSGAEIIQVCQEAAMFALREDINIKEVLRSHFDAALTKVRPQIDPELMKIYDKFASSKLK